jgi:hypothetical protein
MSADGLKLIPEYESIVTDASTTTTGNRRQELCGYPVVEVLTDKTAYLAIGPGGRGVALKKLDPDCLHGGLLHPDVLERLSRVRELAHSGVANLFGVGKDGDDAWLIWEYVEGEPFADYAKRRCTSPRELAALVRELLLTVEALHMQGIVHGAIKSGNVIVAADGRIRLTHVSPLLYDDASEDADAIEEMAGMILDERGERTGTLGRLLTQARETRLPLRALAARFADPADVREVGVTGAAGAPCDAAPGKHAVGRERWTRRRNVLGAVLVTLAGAALAYGAWHAAGEPGREIFSNWLVRLR